jgi:hypothetical protein
VLLEVSLAGGGELDGDELEATVLEARDDGTDQATLWKELSAIIVYHHIQGLPNLTWTPSGLMAMKLPLS